jgi:hypothetical protein
MTKKRQDLFTSAYKNLPNHDKICSFSFGYSILRKVTPSKIFFLFLLRFKSDRSHTGCLMKNASTHNFLIYYPISMNKKIKDMVFQALQNSYKIFFFLVLSSIANDSQLFFFNGHM